MQQHQAAALSVPAPNPTAVSNEGGVDPNLLQNLLSQLQAPQQQAQVCCCNTCLSILAHMPLSTTNLVQSRTWEILSVLSTSYSASAR